MPDHQPLENTATDPRAEATRTTERPQIPDHELLRPIGAGSYGEVWLAKNVMGSFRAVKVVYRKTFESERPYEREFSGIKKFEPISRSHEGFVDILQVGRNDQAGYFYYVMELADDAKGVFSIQSTPPAKEDEPQSGLNTEHWILNTYSPKTLRSEVQRRGRLPVEECLQLSLSLTSALGELHKQGLIHRDIKPSNIIFVNGQPKLADIGLVASVTEARSFVGTAGFIPPEGPGTAQADLYSLGKVLYEISTGKDRTDFPELPTLVREMPDRERLVEFNEAVLRACQNDCGKRYRSASEMHTDLLLLQTGKSLRQTWRLRRRLRLLTKIGIGTVAWGVLAVILLLEMIGPNFFRPGHHSNARFNPSKEQPLIPFSKPLPANLAALPSAHVLNMAYAGSPPATSGQTERPRLQFEILAKPQGTASFRILNDGDTLASGVDDYLIVARPLSAGWLYVFQVDTSGKVDWLFPKNPASQFSNGSNPVEAGKISQLPSAESNRVLYLDNTAGIEHIYAIFCAARWKDLEEALAKPPSLLSATRSTTLTAALQAPLRLGLRGVGGTHVDTTTTEVVNSVPLEGVYQGKAFKLPFSGVVLESSGSFLCAERWFKHVNR